MSNGIQKCKVVAIHVIKSFVLAYSIYLYIEHSYTEYNSFAQITIANTFKQFFKTSFEGEKSWSQEDTAQRYKWFYKPCASRSYQHSASLIHFVYCFSLFNVPSNIGWHRAGKIYKLLLFMSDCSLRLDLSLLRSTFTPLACTVHGLGTNVMTRSHHTRLDVLTHILVMVVMVMMMIVRSTGRWMK